MEEYGSRATLAAAERASDARGRGRERGVEVAFKSISLGLGVSEQTLKDILSTDAGLKVSALEAIAAAASEGAKQAKTEQAVDGDQRG